MEDSSRRRPPAQTSLSRSEWTGPTEASLDYYLLPRIDISMARLRLREENGFSLDAYRFDSLDSFFYLAARTQVRTAA